MPTHPFIVIADNFPQDVKQGLQYIQTLKPENNVRKAFDLAIQLHEDQTRSVEVDKEKHPYVTHLVRVFNIVRNACDIAGKGLSAEEREAMQVASLLHDGVEDAYKETRVKRGELSKQAAREQAVKDIREHFGDKIVAIVNGELTNPLQEFNNLDDKKTWQVEHGKNMQFIESRAVKIADQIANVLSIIEDPGQWDDERKLGYIDKASAVVAACGDDELGHHAQHPATMLLPFLQKLYDLVQDRAIIVCNSVGHPGNKCNLGVLLDAARRSMSSRISGGLNFSSEQQK